MLNVIKEDMSKVIPSFYCMKEVSGNMDIFGMFFTKLSEKTDCEIKFKFKPNEFKPSVYDIFYQEKRGCDYKYGGTYFPTIGILKAIGMADDKAMEIAFIEKHEKLLEYLNNVEIKNF